MTSSKEEVSLALSNSSIAQIPESAKSKAPASRYV
jgi:hypothetical protein